MIRVSVGKEMGSERLSNLLVLTQHVELTFHPGQSPGSASVDTRASRPVHDVRLFTAPSDGADGGVTAAQGRGASRDWAQGWFRGGGQP